MLPRKALVRCVGCLTGWAVASLLGLALSYASEVAGHRDRLNVIVLLADDLGYTGLRCYGSDLHETPHLDRLAAQGVRFTDAYSACTVCSPTRASLLTGKYPARLHLTDFIPGQNRPGARLKVPSWTPYLRREEVTLAERLKKLGYQTGHVGKWHLAPRDDPQGAFGPDQHGFDVQILKPPAKGYFIQPGAIEGDETYVTDYLTRKSLELLEAWQEKPFFLHVAYHVPHTPIQGKPQWVEHYRRRLKPGALHRNPAYAAMVHSLDESVGQILSKLEELNLAERTLVIFLSDNGGLTQRFGKPTGFISNHPLRRGKGSAYEGGTRVPMIVRLPGLTPGGQVTRQMASTIDIVPTVMELVEQTDELDVDGVSLVPVLKEPGGLLKRQELFWHYPHYHAGGDSPYGSIRSGAWKLIEFFEDGRLELYHLAADTGEAKDLSASQPEVTQKLHERLQAWRREVDAQLPSLAADKP